MQVSYYHNGAIYLDRACTVRVQWCIKRPDRTVWATDFASYEAAALFLRRFESNVGAKHFEGYYVAVQD